MESEQSTVLAADAILFDIDGTLVDSTAAVERTWRSWARARNLDETTVLAVCHGRRAADTIADFVEPADRPAAVAEHAQMELADMGDVVALPATPQLLRTLPPERWAAVTSGSRDLMCARLEAAGLPEPTILISGDDVTAGKPDPQGYLLAAEQIGYEIGRCLVIEDSPVGISAGLAAGAPVLAVATSHRPQSLRNATNIVDDLTSVSVAVVPEALEIRLDG